MRLALEGQLTAIEAVEGGSNLTLQVEGEEDARTIFVGEDVDIHLEGDGSIPLDLLGALLECGPLSATVSFAADDPTLVVDVAIEESDIDGEVTEIDASSGLMSVDDTVVGVVSGATILDLRGDDGLIPLSDIAVGDRVHVSRPRGLRRGGRGLPRVRRSRREGEEVEGPPRR